MTIHTPTDILPSANEDQAIRERLLRLSGIRDAAIRRRFDTSGKLATILYLVGYPLPAREQIAMALGIEEQAFLIVALSDFPYDGEGRLDEQRLSRYPVIDGAAEDVPGAKIQPIRALNWNAAETIIVHDDVPSLLEGCALDADPFARTCLSDALAHAAATANDKGIVFIQPGFADGHLSYRQLHEDALRIAGALRARECAVGGALLLQLSEPINFLRTFWGAIYAGIKPVLLSVPNRHTADDPVAQRLLDVAGLFPDAPIACETALEARTSKLLTQRCVLNVESLLDHSPVPERHRAMGGDTAAYFLTSGSTSKPKAVMQSHSNLLAHCVGARQIYDLRPDEITLNWLPLDHVGGVVMFHLRDLYHGYIQHHAPTIAFLQEPLRWLDWISERKITISWAPNFAYNLISTELEKRGPRAWDFSHFHFFINAGETVVRLHAETFVRALSPFGLPRKAMRPLWGMSETCSASIVCHSFHEDMACEASGPVSVGKPFPDVRVRIVDPQGAIVAQGTTGFVQVTGAVVLPGYYENDAANAASFTTDGWFNTGDLGVISKGRLFMMGRAKDLIIINGQNIDPAEIEAQVDKVNGVRPSFTAAVARRDKVDGTDRLSLFFSPDDTSASSGPVVDEIRRRIIAVFGVHLDEIVALPSTAVPKTSIGKIQKEKLKAALEAGNLIPDYSRAPSPEADEIKSRTPRLWRRRWLRRSACGEPVDQSQILPIAHNTVPMVVAKDAIHVLTADTRLEMDALLDVIRTLGESSQIAPQRLLVIARNTERSPTITSIAPLLKTAMDEYSRFECRLVLVAENEIDIDGIIRQEAADRRREIEVSYRDGRRFVSRLAPAVPALASEKITLHPGGTYLVTGGLGGIGRHLCRYLQQRYDARLVIVGRRPRRQIDDDQAATLAELEAHGETVYCAMDCADAAAMEDLAGGIARQFGRIDGVFHLAGDAGEGQISALPHRWLANSVRERADAAALAYALGKRLDAGFVLLFSSVNGYFGGAGAGGYAAACRQQMQFVEDHVSHGAPVLRCINWSIWEQTGMARTSTASELGERKGFKMLAPTIALQMLEQALLVRDGVIFAGIDESRPGMHFQTVAEPVVLEHLEIVSADTGELMPILDRFGTAIPVTRLKGKACLNEKPVTSDIETAGVFDEITASLSRIWMDVLGLKAPPGPSDSVFDLGGQSLLMPQMQNAIHSVLNVEIDILDLFDFVTLKTLSAFIRDKMAEAPA